MKIQKIRRLLAIKSQINYNKVKDNQMNQIPMNNKIIIFN